MIEVIAKLDKSSRARLSWIQSFAASFGIVPRPIYGHITLAALEKDADLTACKSALAGQKAFTVAFERVEVLPGGKAVAAVAAREGALEAVHEILAPGADWTPHTVLLQDDLVDLNWVRRAMGDMFQPFTARIERIEWMEHGVVLDGVDLEGEAV